MCGRFEKFMTSLDAVDDCGIEAREEYLLSRLCSIELSGYLIYGGMKVRALDMNFKI